MWLARQKVSRALTSNHTYHSVYWFFYGTAFVIGILEIMAGELETGVTRFIAVSVKTFVLSLGASMGLLVVGDASQVWFDQASNCERIDLNDEPWRIPLYIACSAAVLGQYRFPLVRYWRALLVMLVGYEVQFQMFHYFATLHSRDNLDTATSNVIGCAAAVVCACGVQFWVRQLRYHYDGHILSPDENADYPWYGKIIYHIMTLGVHMTDVMGLGRKSDRLKHDLEKKLTQAKREVKDPTHERQSIVLEPREENLLLELIVDSQDLNVWSILMPALYQMVPGSMIAKLWFNYIFPPPLIETTQEIPGVNFELTTYQIDEAANNVFAGLMTISTSLALGLIFGFATVQFLEFCWGLVACQGNTDKSTLESRRRAQGRRTGMYQMGSDKMDDPDSVAEEFRKAIQDPIETPEDADRIFDTMDIDRSGLLDREEATTFMLQAGLIQSQIDTLFATMDVDGNGEISREEFREAVMHKTKVQEALSPQKELDVSPTTLQDCPTLDVDEERGAVSKSASSDNDVSCNKEQAMP